ncbi:hypothetical protein L3C95_32465 [Chitinophaga filiformis]|uniref:hypothetical protein n=1 Tax=Chitinophaga filiformis TaxID=104663 RepID=UPI001F44BD1A|nr:hypothetical protein [Chitinophaga filiformis]MCF6407446.1 hypothetical protein [Chitinophaga filiformis]MCF6407648.1 hypothetical protein [Chitinophaga filiformis]
MASGNITIKKSKTLYIVLSILFTGLVASFFVGSYEETKIQLHENPIAAGLFILFFVCVAAFCLYSVFDNKAVIIFSPDGITHKKKIIPWENIKGYKIVESPNDNMTTLSLVLTLKTHPREYTIELLGLNTSEAHIRNCIKTFSDQSIIDEDLSPKN